MTNASLRRLPFLVLGLVVPALVSWAGGCGGGVLSAVAGNGGSGNVAGDDIGPSGAGGIPPSGFGGFGDFGGFGGFGGYGFAGSSGTAGATHTCELDVGGQSGGYGGQGGGYGGQGGGTGGQDGGVVPPGDGRACPCSRRADQPQSFWCPPGVGSISGLLVGLSGGTITIDGTAATAGTPFSIELPPYALSADVLIGLTESRIAPPAPYVDDSPIYEIQPAGLQLAIPAKVSVPITNFGNVIPREVALYQTFNCGASFSRIPDSYQDAGNVVGSMSTLGAVFAGYPRGPDDDAACAMANGGAP
jgi:hypothetical protein